MHAAPDGLHLALRHVDGARERAGPPSRRRQVDAVENARRAASRRPSASGRRRRHRTLSAGLRAAIHADLERVVLAALRVAGRTAPPAPRRTHRSGRSSVILMELRPVFGEDEERRRRSASPARSAIFGLRGDDLHGEEAVERVDRLELRDRRSRQAPSAQARAARFAGCRLWRVSHAIVRRGSRLRIRHFRVVRAAGADVRQVVDEVRRRPTAPRTRCRRTRG